MKQWIVGTISRYRGMISLMVFLQTGAAILVSLQPRYYQRIVSLVIGETPATLLEQGLSLAAWLALLYLSVAAIQGIGGYVGAVFSSNLLKQLQTDFFEKAGRLPIQYFQRESTGEFFTRFNNDVGQAQRFFAECIPTTVRELITMAVVTAILFYFCSALLTLAALGIVFLTSFLVVRLNRAMAGYALKQRKGWSAINRLFEETVHGMDTLKIFGAEKERSRRFQRLSLSFRDLCVRAGSIVAVCSPGIDFISKFGVLLLIVLAYVMISRQTLDSESFLLFFFYTTLLQASVSNLVRSLGNIQNQLVGIRNLSAFFSEPTEKDDRVRDSAKLDNPVSIDIRALTFGYPKGRLLFRDAYLNIPARAVTVVHGPSGSGKSTLINLLLRFYPVGKGTIYFGSKDIRAFSRAELRKKIGIVTQHHHIFNETLRENLLVAKPGATDDEILHALNQALLGDFVKRLPDGIHTVMDPKGKGISGGERQRICIARLLLRKSPVMILDEPWSNLDLEARDILAEVLNACKHSTTILILTHERLSSLSVDRVYSLAPETGSFVIQTPFYPVGEGIKRADGI